MGFADHSHYEDEQFHELNLIAYMEGCRWFEKHLVLEPGIKRTDFESGVSVETFHEIRKRLDAVESVLGDGEIFTLNAKEELYMQREKQLVFVSDMPQGHVLEPSDIAIKISTLPSDYRQLSFSELVGRVTAKNVRQDQAICYGDIG